MKRRLFRIWIEKIFLFIKIEIVIKNICKSLVNLYLKKRTLKMGTLSLIPIHAPHVVPHQIFYQRAFSFGYRKSSKAIHRVSVPRIKDPLKYAWWNTTWRPESLRTLYQKKAFLCSIWPLLNQKFSSGYRSMSMQ